MALPLISAIILVGADIDNKLFNKCLNSVSWCDEVIKVDTQKIKGSFSDWRNEGLKRAKSDWILYVDTDEEVTPSLQDEVIQLINNTLIQINAYAIPRRNFIFGQEFKHGGQYPDYQKRLFLRSNLVGWSGDLHEEPEFNGEMGYLKNPLVHYKDITISEMITKTNKWSEIEANLLFNSNHPKMNLVRFASAGFRELCLRFVKQLCFLDGTKGVIYGIYQIYSKLITYSKLWEKQLYTIRT